MLLSVTIQAASVGPLLEMSPENVPIVVLYSLSPCSDKRKGAQTPWIANIGDAIETALKTCLSKPAHKYRKTFGCRRQP